VIPKTFDQCRAVIDKATAWLKSQKGTKILIKQTCNLGDTLHITPIARHYKTKFPDCKIAFVTGHTYASVHKFNDDFDAIYEINAKASPQLRLDLGRYMMNIKDLDLVLCPSIHPFSSIWKTHVWSVQVIAEQYFLNAKIKAGEMLGDRQLHVELADADIQFAEKFVGDKRLVALEHCSYSSPPLWKPPQFVKLVHLLKEKGIECISFAAPHERLIRGAIDGRGISWRRTVAILARCEYMLGVGSGVTMLAAAARPRPTIMEIGISESITMKSCGYADSIPLNGKITPQDLAKKID